MAGLLINWALVCHPCALELLARRLPLTSRSWAVVRLLVNGPPCARLSSRHSGNLMIADSDKKIDNVIFVAPGGFHCLGLQQNGSVLAWGCNAYGQSDVPVNLNRITAISAGRCHSLALTHEGRVLAWGCNRFGQTAVPDVPGDVVMITSGRNHNLALRSNGTVFAWGQNKFGQCSVPADLVNAVKVSAGEYYSVALKSDGSVVMWGNTSDIKERSTVRT